MIKAVIFDMDGTVLDSEKLYTKYWRMAIEQSGFHISEEDLLGLRSLGSEYAQAYFERVVDPSANEREIRKLRQKLMKVYTDEHPIEVKPGIFETLEALKKRGIQTAIATASVLERAKGFLTGVGLGDSFDRILATSMVEHGKPCPDVYLCACEQLGIRPEEAIAVEDSPNGATSAYRAGCHVIMVPDLTQPDEELLKILDGVAKDLTGVLDYVDRF